MLLVVLAGAGFGYATFHFNESPQQVWQRLVTAIESIKPHTPASTQAD